MPRPESPPLASRLRFAFRRLLHSFAYFIATLVVLLLFVLLLMLAESAFYALTGTPVSIWAMALAAIAAAFGFSPLVHMLQHRLDRLFFPGHLDSLAAIRQLGAGDLARLPVQDIETALLARLCKVSRRSYIALDERDLPNGRLFVYPTDAPRPEGKHVDAYDFSLPLPRGSGRAYLWLGPRKDGWPTSQEERASLESLAKFAAMSLEHARLTHQQAEAARLDSLSRVVRQLHSHDLKNRLHDLSFLAHHLEADHLEPEEIRQLVDAIRKVSGRMQTLMKRLTDPRAPLNPAIAPVDIAALLQESIRNRLWPEGIRIQRNLESMPPVAADAELIASVLETLFDNAVQAMQGKGVLDIRVHPVKGKKGMEAEIRVSDTGCGIDRDFLQHQLFQLFATSKPNGLGVGLFLSRRIILAHGGTITANSEGVGKGCTFIIRLPLWHDAGSNKKTKGQA